MRKIWRMFVVGLINALFSGTHFWGVKRVLLNSCGIVVGYNTKIVGPISCGNVINIHIGNNTWIGKDISFDGNGEVYIGDNVDIAPHCVISTGGHDIGTATRRAGEGKIFKIVIGDGCWIGTNVTIVNSTCIGNGCIVGAGSVVIKSCNENMLIAGCPAKTKKRYI